MVTKAVILNVELSSISDGRYSKSPATVLSYRIWIPILFDKTFSINEMPLAVWCGTPHGDGTVFNPGDVVYVASEDYDIQEWVIMGMAPLFAPESIKLSTGTLPTTGSDSTNTVLSLTGVGVFLSANFNPDLKNRSSSITNLLDKAYKFGAASDILKRSVTNLDNTSVTGIADSTIIGKQEFSYDTWVYIDDLLITRYNENYTKLSSKAVTPRDFSYLRGLSSPVQEQINATNRTLESVISNFLNTAVTFSDYGVAIDSTNSSSDVWKYRSGLLGGGTNENTYTYHLRYESSAWSIYIVKATNTEVRLLYGISNAELLDTYGVALISGTTPGSGNLLTITIKILPVSVSRGGTGYSSVDEVIADADNVGWDYHRTKIMSSDDFDNLTTKTSGTIYFLYS